MAGESSRDQCAKECNGCSTCSSEPSQPKKATVTVFKNLQEIYGYLFNGGAVEGRYKNQTTVVRFVNGLLTPYVFFDNPEHWSPYVEPVAKTKVWRWERIGSTTSIIGLEKTIEQTASLHTEEYAKHHLKHYTKVPNSERDI